MAFLWNRCLLMGVALVGVSLIGPASKTSGRTESTAGERLIGTWHVVPAGTFRKDGAFEAFPEYGPNAIGYLMYDSTGDMCVSLANPVHPRWANPEKPAAQEKILSYDRTFAYCGSYEVREKEGQVIHRPELCSWPHYIGTHKSTI